MQAVLNILEPQLHNCQPPPPSEDISSWDSMDLASAPSHAPSQSSTGDFTGGSSITNASSSHPLVKQTRVEMTSTLLPRWSAGAWSSPASWLIIQWGYLCQSHDSHAWSYLVRLGSELTIYFITDSLRRFCFSFIFRRVMFFHYHCNFWHSSHGKSC